ncbi:STK36 family protein [Megaselia abdita]
MVEGYHNLTKIGEGSFGKVYKANHKVTEAIVAIKVISKGGRTLREIKTLRRECDIQRKLKHPNVIEMLETFDCRNNLVIVTEFASTDLHKYLAEKGVFNEEMAKKLSGDLVSALYYLHSNRVLHRDLKPQNVLLNEDLHAKLCDFGLARSMTMQTQVLTSIKGTPLYMAPEILSENPYDHQADLWSLGCIIYESMVGKPPFYTTNILQLGYMIQKEEVKWPEGLSNASISLIQGLLEKDPSFRTSWAQIICNPFLEGHLYLEGCGTSFEKDDTNIPISESPEYDNLSHNLELLNLTAGGDRFLNNSQDSINANYQTDVENIETDVEEISVPFLDRPSKYDLNMVNSQNPCAVSGNSNLVISNFNENFAIEVSKDLGPLSPTVKAKPKLSLQKSPCMEKRNKDLEKRKLSQNLENFSLRLGETSKPNNEEKGKSDEKRKSQPNLLPSLDSFDETQSQMMENEEWLAFIKKNMHELMEGDFGTISELSMVSIIVAPLRNPKAGAKVVENVAVLLSLPLVLGAPEKVMDGIKSVYAEVKLVPNLMYSLKLLTNVKSNAADSIASTIHPEFEFCEMRDITDISRDEFKTISRMLEVVCQLVHLKDSFLSQFCDAVTILPADDLLIYFLNNKSNDEYSARILVNILSILMCILMELPENSNIVEGIVNNSNFNFEQLIQHKSVLVRMKSCLFLRVLLRVCETTALRIWRTNNNFKIAFEKLKNDENNEIQNESSTAINELSSFK